MYNIVNLHKCGLAGVQENYPILFKTVIVYHSFKVHNKTHLISLVDKYCLFVW